MARWLWFRGIALVAVERAERFLEAQPYRLGLLVGELDAALRLACLDHFHLARWLALRFEWVSPIGLRACAKQAGKGYGIDGST